MTRIRDQLISRENLGWAWLKARRLYQSADGPVDFGEVAAFELDLEQQLASIATDFKSGDYRLAPLVLLPQPKKPDENGDPQMRQSFHVSVRDQVAWIALINVIGPILDSAMPAWSYGHRLYKAAWYEDDDGRSRLELGPYRHSSGNLYRRFKHSWPLFRRHISLTARMMVNTLGEEDQLDSAERSALTHTDRPPYLNKTYWPSVTDTRLYYASIDLSKFYPSITKAAIIRALRKYLSDFAQDEWLAKLTSSLLSFNVGRNGSRMLGHEMVKPHTDAGAFDRIPTGLMVAGFLSNIAMLPIDQLVVKRLNASSRIAHFRFVDDHAILAYDFDELRKWIREYERALKRLSIGPKIAPDKFDPKVMAVAYQLKADKEKRSEAEKESRIDGGHPSKLMTKTLALVSELAGAEFDILSEDSRSQRLRELEWLLLANLPDREIRSDTRAAFAAGRIASLVPIAISPSVDLLTAWRRLARLRASARKEDEKEIPSAVTQVRIATRADRKRYESSVNHHFKLIFQAFCDHPDKPRLFIRILDYCRVTGHDGTNKVLGWIERNQVGPQRFLADYLRLVATQSIARHVLSAAFDISDSGLLWRQRNAARRYLGSIGLDETRRLLSSMVDNSRGDDVASRSARVSFLAAVAGGLALVQKQDLPKTRAALNKLAFEIGAPNISSSSLKWKRVTGSPIGVWAHWLDSLLKQNERWPGAIWAATAQSHDPKLELDWLSLRKGPQQLPENQAAYLSRTNHLKLTQSDAGWLLDQQNSPHPIKLRSLRANAAVRALQSHRAELSTSQDRVTALAWTTHIASLRDSDPYDPRASEWTALEILRQLIAQIMEFPGLDLAVLDELHPSNILLPKFWLERNPPKKSLHTRWTWESWRYVMRNGPPIKIVKNSLKDFRRQPPYGGGAATSEMQWRSRLRGAGLLLLGLIAHNFNLPSRWNVRGMERDTSSFVKSTLEEVPLSSLSHGIIEAALLPRSSETALMRINQWPFFGEKTVTKINDTKTDPPLIQDVHDLLDEIVAAQATLERSQISVRDHAPRQLIPMNVIQLVGAAIEVVQDGEP